MTTQRLYILLLIALIVCTACEEVIEIDLNSAAPAIVAEAVIAVDEKATLKLHYTSDYFKDEPAESISNAMVTIQDKYGNIDTLRNMSDGMYLGTKLLGNTNNVYTMSIGIDEETYEASTQILSSTSIISSEVINVEESKNIGDIGSSYYNYRLTFTDNPNEDNHYLCKFIVNGQLYSDYYYLIRDYKAEDGMIEYVPSWLFLAEGDTIRTELYAIDEKTYTYYSQLNDSDGGFSSSTPYNPISNFGSDVMGYFAGWSRDLTTIIVEPPTESESYE